MILDPTIISQRLKFADPHIAIDYRALFRPKSETSSKLGLFISVRISSGGGLGPCTIPYRGIVRIKEIRVVSIAASGFLNF